MHSDAAIMSFRGKFGFLSNFYPQRIVYLDREWETSEHAYQASKTMIGAERESIAACPTPGRAKRYGRSKEDGGVITQIRPDWTDVRVGIMFDILEAKFSIPELERKLLDTGNLKLVEGNFHKDRFWGVDAETGEGQNMLGQLLMRIREEKRSFS